MRCIGCDRKFRDAADFERHVVGNRCGEDDELQARGLVQAVTPSGDYWRRAARDVEPMRKAA